MKLYSPQKPGLYLLPAMYLIEDKEKSEWITLVSAQGDAYTLSGPLRYPHSRGAALFRVRLQKTDEEGKLFLLFEDSATQTICVQSEKKYQMHEIPLPPSGEGIISV